MRNIEIPISKRFDRTCLKALMLVTGVLCLSNFASNYYFLFLAQDVPQEVLGANLRDGVGILDVDAEGSLPTWFSSSMLLLCSALLAVITYARKRAGDTYAFHWGGLSVIFVLLSLDEGISIHERLNEQLQSFLGTGGLLYFPWVIPGAAFVAIWLLLYRRFLFNLPMKSRRLFVAAGALYVSGSIGMEMVAGYHVERHGSQNLPYLTLVTIEEFLEMFGTILFFYALLRYRSRYLEVDE